MNLSCCNVALQCFLCVSFVDEDKLRVVKKSRKKRLQETKPLSLHQRKVRCPNYFATLATLNLNKALF